MFEKLVKLLKIHKEFEPKLNEFKISAEAARTILLNGDMISDKINWGRPMPRWADFFDVNNPNHSIPVYQSDTFIRGTYAISHKTPIGKLMRYSEYNVWVISSNDRIQHVYNVLNKMGIL